MTRPPHVLRLITLVTLSVCRATAEDQPSLLAPTAPVASSAPSTPRPISSRAAAQLAAAAPKFTPEAQPDADVTANPARAPDKPRNTIIRLPSYIVNEPKIRLPKERDMMTPKGRLEIALKRYPGLRFGNIWFLRNDGIALMMLEEDLRLERMREMADLLSILPASYQQDPKVKRSAQEILMRPPVERTTGSRTMGGK